jgi:hypothetical protein
MNNNDRTDTCRQTKGSFSVFQQVMRQWSDIHPYNAVHLFRFEGPADIHQLTESIEHAWQSMDFGTASIHKRQYGFSYIEGRRPEIKTIEPGDNPTQTLHAYMAEQLNFRFPTQDYSPIRFSVMQETTCHYLCVTYDHWICDGVAIRLLLRPVLCGYCGDPDYQSADTKGMTDDAKQISFYPPTYRKAYRKYFSTRIQRLSQWWRYILANNVTIQSPARHGKSMDAQYIAHEFSNETLQNVLNGAKRYGVTVHDLFLAAITRACMPYLPPHLVKRKRRRMGIGSIVNTRNMADMELDHAIAIYLGYFVTHTRTDQADSLGGLAQSIAKKTRAVKEKKLYLNTAIGMKIQCIAWPFLPQFAKAGFVQNSLPLSAGISNSHVKETWMLNLCDSPQRRLLSYSRATPTGPVIPISFAPTTMADSLHMGVTWRPSCFDHDTVEKITAQIESDLLNGMENE